MKRFLLASVMALTATVMPAVAFADEPAPPTVAAPTPPTAPTVAPVVAPVVAPAAPPAAVRPAPVAVVTTTGATVPAAAKPVTSPVTSPASSPASSPVTAPAAAAPAPVVTAAALPAAAPAPAPAPAVTAAVPLAAPTAAPAADGTPLATHATAPAKPLALAPQSEGLGIGYKLLAVLAIGGAVALYLKKKRGPKVAGIVPSKIDILARAGLGVRSQLVVVEVEGTRLLVGMTPSAIQTLAVLQTPEDDNVAAEARASAIEDRLEQEREIVRPANLGDRVRSLLGSDEPIAPPRLSAVKAATAKPKARSAPRASAAPATSRKSESVPRESREVAGQARGLLLSVDEDT